MMRAPKKTIAIMAVGALLAGGAAGCGGSSGGNGNGGSGPQPLSPENYTVPIYKAQDAAGQENQQQNQTQNQADQLAP